MIAATPVLTVLVGCREAMVPSGRVPRDAPMRWDAALADVVTDDGLVDYDALEARREDLDAFVGWLARPEALAGPAKIDRHAFWINAYNALTLYQVLERGRPASVLDVDGWLPIPGSGFFVETEFQVGPDRLSLSDIEHERIRMLELDPRDHAALNCASRGCPPLRASLYRPMAMSTQLDVQMRRWVDDPERGVRVEGDEAIFSAIFQWYARDFDVWTAGMDLCTFTARFASPPLDAELTRLARRGCPHRFAPYDWALNDASP